MSTSGTCLRIATRASQLALWQAESLRSRLADCYPQHRFEPLPLQTHADRSPQTPLRDFDTRGVFTKEIQRAVLDGLASFAVHSLKDLPTAGPEELCLGAVLERGPVEDALVSRDGQDMDALPRAARVGTGSLRRQAQLLAWRPDLRIEPLRGNIPTRLAKIERLGLDAIVVARAALARLGLEHRMSQVLPVERFLPGAGQGAVAVECRRDDDAARALLHAVDHLTTRQAVTAERALLHGLGGGCRLPVGALAQVDGDHLHLQAVVVSPNGSTAIRDTIRGPADLGDSLGRQLAEALLAQGADKLLHD